MESRTRDIDELARRRERVAGGEDFTIRSISREIGEDLKRLGEQHVALLKKESSSTAKLAVVGLSLAGLAMFLMAFGVIRLIEAAVGAIMLQAGWVGPNLVLAISGLVLLLVAGLIGLIIYLVTRKIRANNNEIVNELKEDWRWLKKNLP